MTKRRNSLLGQSLVEFAILLPLLLLIMIFLFDLGRAVYYYSVIHNAAREGARYGIIINTDGVGCSTPDEEGIEDAIHDRAIGLNIAALSVSSSCVNIYDENDFLISSKIRVDVTYEFEPVTPLVGMFLSDVDGDGLKEIVLHSTSTMNVEG